MHGRIALHTPSYPTYFSHPMQLNETLYKYVNMSIHVYYLNKPLNTYRRTQLYLCTHTYTFTCIHACIQQYIHTNMNPYIHNYIHLPT